MCDAERDFSPWPALRQSSLDLFLCKHISLGNVCKYTCQSSLCTAVCAIVSVHAVFGLRIPLMVLLLVTAIQAPQCQSVTSGLCCVTCYRWIRDVRRTYQHPGYILIHSILWIPCNTVFCVASGLLIFWRFWFLVILNEGRWLAPVTHTGHEFKEEEEDFVT